jgi:hypothetical protein
MYHFSVAIQVCRRGKQDKNYHIDEAVVQINQSEYGAHYLLIYPNLIMLRELYRKYIKTQLEYENKIVLLPAHYETADNVRNILLDDSFPATDNNKDVKRYEDAIIVMDSVKAHFGVGNHIGFVNELVKRVQNGVSVIADAGSFFHLKKSDKLIEHELSMPSQFDVNLTRFCVFHKQDFNNHTAEQR